MLEHFEHTENAVEIIAFLVTQYRKAFNHGGDYKAIETARGVYCKQIQENSKLTEDELHAIYLQGKIKADEEQLLRHEVELKELYLKIKRR